MTKLWEFEALDTLFFRESRPLSTIGGAQLISNFPPPARTIIGAIRTAIGEANDVVWEHFQQSDQYADLREVMGDSTHFGRLDFRGPFLLKKKKRLYPAPLMLLAYDEHNSKEYIRLRPGQAPVMCDLGKVLLPELEIPKPGAKPLENHWLTESGLEKVLLGLVPDKSEVIPREEVFHEEERLGIARDNRSRANLEGLLYQTRHIRPHTDISVGVEVKRNDNKPHITFPSKGIIRLGGEGRMGSFSVNVPPASLNITLPEEVQQSNKVLLTLLTAGDFGGWMLPGFISQKSSERDEWHGIIAGVELKILSATIGKPVREGGWDIAGRRPRPLRNMVPPGSCYFCEVKNMSAADAIRKLQGSKVGNEAEIGRGELAVGIW